MAIYLHRCDVLVGVSDVPKAQAALVEGGVYMGSSPGVPARAGE